MSIAVQIAGLSVRYGSFVAVDALDLEVRRGELCGLIGPNGAGKSSTLRVLIGQRKPTEGSVTVLGRDIVKEWAAVKPHFGYVPDQDNHFDELTGRRNLLIYAGLYRVTPARVEECLRMVELHHAAETRVRSYSLGMRRKLLLARAVLHEPDVLYLDEPTANLDVHSAAIVHEILKSLAAQGCTVLLTTHDMREVEELCERVAVIQNGKRVALGAPTDLLRRGVAPVVEATLNGGDVRSFALEDDAARGELASLIERGDVTDLRTRSGDLRDAFLRMTGNEKVATGDGESPS